MESIVIKHLSDQQLQTLREARGRPETLLDINTPIQPTSHRMSFIGHKLR